MANFKIYRVITLPALAEIQASAMYVVQGTAADKAELYFSNNDGTAVRRLLTQADVEQLIADAVPESANQADKLTTPRKIAATGDATYEVTFDGSSDVNATLTLKSIGAAGEGTVITFNEKGLVTGSRALAAADIPSLPGSKITSELSVDTTGNAATATEAQHAATADKLKTPVAINGVQFDGSAPITISAVDTATPRIAASEKAQPNGVATLDANGFVPSNQLPSYVDDVLEFANFAALPVAGEMGKIYVTLDDNAIYRWSGSLYIRIPGGVGLADSALKLETARNIAATGDITFSVSFDGTANVSGAATLATIVEAGETTVPTFDAKGRVTGGRALVAGDIPSLDETKVTSAAAIALAANEW